MLKVTQLVCGLETVFWASGPCQRLQGSSGAPSSRLSSWHLVNVCLPASHYPTCPSVSSMRAAPVPALFTAWYRAGPL